ncbi:thioredoxin domain-containing protein 3 [Tiliqua scincoides]|uniref:thioredoxin domain-containing protein 3 n=1 Tax=Tiliqua scincoides TaxID=71010 RepID=UPI0034625DEA
MASKKKEVQLQSVIHSQAQWDEMLLVKGLTVVDVYQAWCGPCKAVVNLFRKLKNEYGEDDLLHFAVAEADNIVTLTPFKDKCEPAFVFCVDGKMIDIVKGANGPLLTKKIIATIEKERKIVAGEIPRPEVQELVILEEKESDEEIEEEEVEGKCYCRSQGLSEEFYQVSFGSLPKEEGAMKQEEEKYTVVIIKPDAVAGGKAEEIKTTITQAGFIINAEDEKILTEEQIRNFYGSRSSEPEFEDFVAFMMSGPSHILIVTEGKQAPDIMPLVSELGEAEEEEEEEEEEGEGEEFLKGLQLIHNITIIPCLLSLQGVLEEQEMLNLCDIQDSVEEASRQLAFFFPERSRSKKGPFVERTLALIRPSLLRERRDSILQRIKDDGFTIAMQREIVLTEAQARDFYKEHENEDYFPVLLEQMTSGPTLALALVRENAVQKWRGLLGPKIVEEAKEQSPESLRATFAIEGAPLNQLHGSSTPDQAAKELGFFFPVENTFAVIKPTAYVEHKQSIIKKVKEAGFIISETKETQITPEMAAQFYKAREGQDYYNDLVEYMSNGPSMVMILTKENAVEEWRSLMGPVDPEKAKEEAPHSLRAQFAEDVLRNAVHGASNEDHAIHNIRYVFGDVDLESLKSKYVYV